MEQPQTARGTRSSLDTLIWLLESAFDRDPVQSLMANLSAFRDEEWTVYLPGADRSVGEVIEHVAWTKRMYVDYAFGSRSLRGDQPPMTPANGARTRPRTELLAWLAESQHLVLSAVRTLNDDAELDELRLAHWGKEIPTRDIIEINIGHDYYHAGEINHLRALLQDTDKWVGPRGTAGLS